MAAVTYAFGDFELDTATYELRTRGHAVELQPKVLELLAYLLERRDRVVGKRELLEALWPDVRVGESSLAWCVSQARKALGQARTAGGPIETVHGRGYRFRAEVKPRASLPPPPAAGLFVGRQAAMGALAAAVERALKERRGSAHVLLGEAGIGKTRCAEELVAAARAAGASAWVGRCLEDEGAPAFWPWIQVLRQAARDGVAADALLADLVPREAAPADPTFMGARQEGFWILDRMARLLLGGPDDAPRVLVVDDLHWADLPSLRLLELLANELDDHAVTVVATLRDTDEPRHPSCKPVLERLRRRFEGLPLSAFRAAEVEACLAHAMGRAPSAAVVADVHRRTGGNPLFVHAMAQRLVERADRGEAGGLEELADLGGARGLVLGRLDRRDPALRGTLEAASVLGDAFELPVLAATMDATPESLVPVLDGAVRARLLERRSAAGAFVFVHDLVRLAIQAEMSEAARCRWHRRAGEALEGGAPDAERLTRMAHHFHQALPAGTHAKAVAYSTAAAREAARVFAHEEARAHWLRALEALDFEDVRSDAERCAVLTGLASTELHLGMRAESRERARVAVQLAKRAGDGAQLLAAARVLRHSLLSHVSVDPLARDALESALPLLDDAADRTSALSLLGAVHLAASPDPRSREASEEALGAARERGGQGLLEALWSRAFWLAGPGDVSEALRVTEEMLRLDAALGRSWWSGEAHYAAFCAHAYRGDMAAAERSLEELGGLAKYCRLREAQWHHERLRAQLALQRGAVDASEAAWSELAGRPGLAALNYVRAIDPMHRLLFAIARDDRPADRDELARRLARWSPGPRAEAMAVRALLDGGHAAEARRRFEDLAGRGVDALPRDRTFLACASALAFTAVALEDRPRAGELEAVLEPFAAFNAPDLLVTTMGSVALPLAVLAHFLGDARKAADRFELAIARNAEMGLRAHQARAELAYARSLGEGRAGRPRAAALVRSARSTASDLGLPGLLEEARAAERALR